MAEKRKKKSTASKTSNSPASKRVAKVSRAISRGASPSRVSKLKKKKRVSRRPGKF